ncbi:hypothetical protein [Desulfofalx alkaliphila]|uniref:hypothetical protein n=1 Tax=Desulfofalx alkaliphila TaxID=105483 RepID=UPI0004E19BAD|nr:hypothetical protein [Desulfofalx alkaliphila]
MGDQGFELNITEETGQKIEQIAKKNNQTEEEVCEYILKEFLQNQLHVIEKRAKEVNEPVEKLVNMQFERLVDYLHSQK